MSIDIAHINQNSLGCLMIFEYQVILDQKVWELLHCTKLMNDVYSKKKKLFTILLPQLQRKKIM